ncbi:General transcription factor 3C polypeptide 2, partial [Stegodyphus mimosarum]
MQLGIAHKHGIIWDMAWCPSGCWEDPDSEYSSDDMPCLGLLAVACSNSNIYIYSIPHPESLASFTENAPLYSTSPSAVLHPLFGDPCFGTRKSMCISLCWQKSDAYER